MKKETTIQSIDRAMEMLLLFTRNRPKLGITEISQSLGLAKGTVHGLVRTLSKAGFLQQDPESRKYRLGLKIYELGMILAGTLEINDKAGGPTAQLARRTGMVAKIAIWDGSSALLVLHIDPKAHSLFTHQIGPEHSRLLLGPRQGDSCPPEAPGTRSVPRANATHSLHVADHSRPENPSIGVGRNSPKGLFDRPRRDSARLRLHWGTDRGAGRRRGGGHQPVRQLGAVLSQTGRQNRRPCQAAARRCRGNLPFPRLLGQSIGKGLGSTTPGWIWALQKRRLFPI